MLFTLYAATETTVMTPTTGKEKVLALADQLNATKREQERISSEFQRFLYNYYATDDFPQRASANVQEELAFFKCILGNSTLINSGNCYFPLKQALAFFAQHAPDSLELLDKIGSYLSCWKEVKTVQ